MHLNKNKYVIGCLAFLLIAVCVLAFYLYGLLCATGVSMKPHQVHQEVRYDSSGKTVYILMKEYGLQLQHCRTVISSRSLFEESVPVDVEHDVILQDIGEIFYKKVEPDSLSILIPSYLEGTDTRVVGGISVSVAKISRDSIEAVSSREGYKKMTICD